jgi:hypothetical protein
MNITAECETYVKDGVWSMKVLTENYDWQFVAELLNLLYLEAYG